MAEPARDRGKTTPAHGAPQPTTPSNERRAGMVRSGVVTAIIVTALLGVMYGLTAHRVEMQDAHHRSEMEKGPTLSPSPPSGS